MARRRQNRRGFLPGGVGEAMALFGAARMSTAILKYPSGRYGIAGSVPAELTEPDVRSLTPGTRRSKVWDSEQDVIDALLAIGVTKFQRADCSWYQPEPLKTCPDCGSELLIESPCVIEEPVLEANHIRGTELPRRTRLTTAALCTGCEFCKELIAAAEMPCSGCGCRPGASGCACDE